MNHGITTSTLISTVPKSNLPTVKEQELLHAIKLNTAPTTVRRQNYEYARLPRDEALLYRFPDAWGFDYDKFAASSAPSHSVSDSDDDEEEDFFQLSRFENPHALIPRPKAPRVPPVLGPRDILIAEPLSPANTETLTDLAGPRYKRLQRPSSPCFPPEPPVWPVNKTGSEPTFDTLRNNESPGAYTRTLHPHPPSSPRPQLLAVVDEFARTRNRLLARAAVVERKKNAKRSPSPPPPASISFHAPLPLAPDVAAVLADAAATEGKPLPPHDPPLLSSAFKPVPGAVFRERSSVTLNDFAQPLPAYSPRKVARRRSQRALDARAGMLAEKQRLSATQVEASDGLAASEGTSATESALATDSDALRGRAGDTALGLAAGAGGAVLGLTVGRDEPFYMPLQARRTQRQRDQHRLAQTLAVGADSGSTGMGAGDALPQRLHLDPHDDLCTTLDTLLMWAGVDALTSTSSQTASMSTSGTAVGYGLTTTRSSHSTHFLNGYRPVGSAARTQRSVQVGVVEGVDSDFEDEEPNHYLNGSAASILAHEDAQGDPDLRELADKIRNSTLRKRSRYARHILRLRAQRHESLEAAVSRLLLALSEDVAEFNRERGDELLLAPEVFAAGAKGVIHASEALQAQLLQALPRPEEQAEEEADTGAGKDGRGAGDGAQGIIPSELSVENVDPRHYTPEALVRRQAALFQGVLWATTKAYWTTTGLPLPLAPVPSTPMPPLPLPAAPSGPAAGATATAAEALAGNVRPPASTDLLASAVKPAPAPTQGALTTSTPRPPGTTTIPVSVPPPRSRTGSVPQLTVGMSRQQYFTVMMLLRRHLLPDAPMATAMLLIEADWLRDTGNAALLQAIPQPSIYSQPSRGRSRRGNAATDAAHMGGSAMFASPSSEALSTTASPTRALHAHALSPAPSFAGGAYALSPSPHSEASLRSRAPSSSSDSDSESSSHSPTRDALAPCPPQLLALNTTASLASQHPLSLLLRANPYPSLLSMLQLHQALHQLADLWTASTSAADYARFLARLYLLASVPNLVSKEEAAIITARHALNSGVPASASALANALANAREKATTDAQAPSASTLTVVPRADAQTGDNAGAGDSSLADADAASPVSSSPNAGKRAAMSRIAALYRPRAPPPAPVPHPLQPRVWASLTPAEAYALHAHCAYRPVEIVSLAARFTRGTMPLAEYEAYARSLRMPGSGTGEDDDTDGTGRSRDLTFAEHARLLAEQQERRRAEFMRELQLKRLAQMRANMRQRAIREKVTHRASTAGREYSRKGGRRVENSAARTARMLAKEVGGRARVRVLNSAGSGASTVGGDEGAYVDEAGEAGDDIGDEDGTGADRDGRRGGRDGVRADESREVGSNTRDAAGDGDIDRDYADGDTDGDGDAGHDPGSRRNRRRRGTSTGSADMASRDDMYAIVRNRDARMRALDRNMLLAGARSGQDHEVDAGDVEGDLCSSDEELMREVDGDNTLSLADKMALKRKILAYKRQERAARREEQARRSRKRDGAQKKLAQRDVVGEVGRVMAAVRRGQMADAGELSHERESALGGFAGKVWDGSDDEDSNALDTAGRSIGIAGSSGGDGARGRGKESQRALVARLSKPVHRRDGPAAAPVRRTATAVKVLAGLGVSAGPLEGAAEHGLDQDEPAGTAAPRSLEGAGAAASALANSSEFREAARRVGTLGLDAHERERRTKSRGARWDDVVARLNKLGVDIGRGRGDTAQSGKAAVTSGGSRASSRRSEAGAEGADGDGEGRPIRSALRGTRSAATVKEEEEAEAVVDNLLASAVELEGLCSDDEEEVLPVDEPGVVRRVREVLQEAREERERRRPVVEEEKNYGDMFALLFGGGDEEKRKSKAPPKEKEKAKENSAALGTDALLALLDTAATSTVAANSVPPALAREILNLVHTAVAAHCAAATRETEGEAKDGLVRGLAGSALSRSLGLLEDEKPVANATGGTSAKGKRAEAKPAESGRSEVARVRGVVVEMGAAVRRLWRQRAKEQEEGVTGEGLGVLASDADAVVTYVGLGEHFKPKSLRTLIPVAGGERLSRRERRRARVAAVLRGDVDMGGAGEAEVLARIVATAAKDDVLREEVRHVLDTLMQHTATTLQQRAAQLESISGAVGTAAGGGSDGEEDEAASEVDARLLLRLGSALGMDLSALENALARLREQRETRAKAAGEGAGGNGDGSGRRVAWADDEEDTEALLSALSEGADMDVHQSIAALAKRIGAVVEEEVDYYRMLHVAPPPVVRECLIREEKVAVRKAIRSRARTQARMLREAGAGGRHETTQDSDAVVVGVEEGEDEDEAEMLERERERRWLLRLGVPLLREREGESVTPAVVVATAPVGALAVPTEKACVEKQEDARRAQEVWVRGLGPATVSGQSSRLTDMYVRAVTGVERDRAAARSLRGMDKESSASLVSFADDSEDEVEEDEEDVGGVLEELEVLAEALEVAAALRALRGEREEEEEPTSDPLPAPAETMPSAPVAAPVLSTRQRARLLLQSVAAMLTQTHPDTGSAGEAMAAGREGEGDSEEPPSAVLADDRDAAHVTMLLTARRGSAAGTLGGAGLSTAVMDAGDELIAMLGQVGLEAGDGTASPHTAALPDPNTIDMTVPAGTAKAELLDLVPSTHVQAEVSEAHEGAGGASAPSSPASAAPSRSSSPSLAGGVSQTALPGLPSLLFDYPFAPPTLHTATRFRQRATPTAPPPVFTASSARYTHTHATMPRFGRFGAAGARLLGRQDPAAHLPPVQRSALPEVEEPSPTVLPPLSARALRPPPSYLRRAATSVAVPIVRPNPPVLSPAVNNPRPTTPVALACPSFPTAPATDTSGMSARVSRPVLLAGSPPVAERARIPPSRSKLIRSKTQKAVTTDKLTTSLLDIVDDSVYDTVFIVPNALPFADKTLKRSSQQTYLLDMTGPIVNKVPLRPDEFCPDTNELKTVEVLKVCSPDILLLKDSKILRVRPTSDTRVDADGNLLIDHAFAALPDVVRANDEYFRANPTDINGTLDDADDSVVDVAVGEYHYAVLTRKGFVFTFGRNELGQLSLGLGAPCG